jgi:hypothetical protein
VEEGETGCKTMTIHEWKQEFAKLYIKMKEDIGTDNLEVRIYEKGNAFQSVIKTEVIID